jgi:hypothetical protein
MESAVDSSSAGRVKLVNGDKVVLIEYDVHHLDYPDTSVKVEIRDVRESLLFKKKETLFYFESEYLGKIDVEENLYTKINDYLSNHESQTV